jgi:small-conductance mechanosensitive channel
MVLLTTPAARAQSAAADPQVPPKVGELIDLLQDPGVRQWLEKQKAMPAAAAALAPAEAESGLTRYAAKRIDAIQKHFGGLAAALPQLPSDFAKAAAQLRSEIGQRGLAKLLFLLAAFAALGWGVRWLYWRWTANLRSWLNTAPMDSTAERLRALGVRSLCLFGRVVAFAIGSIGAFMLFDWPPMLRQLLLSLIFAIVLIGLAWNVLAILLAPDDESGKGQPERFRILPMTGDRAVWWTSRLGLATAWFAAGYAVVLLLRDLGFPFEASRLVAYVLGLGLLVIGLEMVWRRPAIAVAASETSGPAGAQSRIGADRSSWLLSAYFVLLWLLWVASAMVLFWLAVAAVALPAATRMTRGAVNHLFQPGASPTGGAGRPSVIATCLERGIRVLLIGGAVVGLANVLEFDLNSLAAEDSFANRMIRGAISAAVILLVADFAWHIAKTFIDRAIADAGDPGEVGTEVSRRRGRIRTLLPIVRNVLFVTLAAVALLMALSSLGVQVAPLIAGAGVVGVAVGFGAQTLVKDVISGMFYLLDDAFRIGEYIQSGSYRGTVESFSIRSIKLRHHRGPIFTVPFGELGAVQNMSRDWVIDKMLIGVTYDSDTEKARKLIKAIGQELLKDPEYGHQIFEPLKMKGLDSFGDYGVQLVLKMKTTPGEQSAIRRLAYLKIKEAFDKNGIKFAFPTVQVAGGSDPAAAAARQVLARKAAETALAAKAG